MPWKACSIMDERLRFIARLLEGESMSALCREAGISRKTGYKVFNRYKEEGVTAISDRSRRPWRYANQLPSQLEALIVGLRKDKPHWGARKLRELLAPPSRTCSASVACPEPSGPTTACPSPVRTLCSASPGS